MVLVDNHTKKKAVLFYRKAANFVLGHEGGSCVQDPVGRRLSLANTDIFFDFKIEVDVSAYGLLRLVLIVSTPMGLCEGDFHRLFQSSLEWM